MSAATLSTTAPITHLPRTAHPLPLREQAFTLHCQGLRSPTIAEALGVPERTIRSWIAAALNEIKEDQQFSRREQLALAVERQRALTAAAWQQFERESAARATLLDAAIALTTAHPDPTAAAPAMPTTGTLTAPDAPAPLARPTPQPLHLHLPATTPAPRYLSLILQANKEINRLLGLYTLARLEILRPDSLADQTESPVAVEDDPGAPLDSPAESATALDRSAPGEARAEGEIPAESATAPFASSQLASPLAAYGERPGVRSPLPAESATASTTPPSPAFRPLAAPAPATRGRDLSSPAKTATAPLAAYGERPGVRTPGVRTTRPWLM